jgi:hypothetical protein
MGAITPTRNGTGSATAEEIKAIRESAAVMIRGKCIANCEWSLLTPLPVCQNFQRKNELIEL